MGRNWKTRDWLPANGIPGSGGAQSPLERLQQAREVAHKPGYRLALGRRLTDTEGGSRHGADFLDFGEIDRFCRDIDPHSQKVTRELVVLESIET
jgi:hypothetical protein